MSVGWEFIWCPVSRITTEIVSLDFDRLIRAARETTNHCSFSVVTDDKLLKYCRYGIKLY